MVRINLFIIFLILISCFSFAQNQNDQRFINSEFDLAVKLFNSGQYNDALQIFQKITNDYSLNFRTTASLILESKILLKQKNYVESEKILTDFLEKYPESRYANEARITLIAGYIKTENYVEALKQTGAIISTSDTGYYHTYAKKIGESIGINYLAGPQIELLYNQANSDSAKAYFLLLTGKVFLSNHDRKDADSCFNKVVNDFPLSAEKAEAQKLLSSGVLTFLNQQGPDLIGVMLPLKDKETDKTITAGMEILDGIRFAVSEFNKNRKDKIGIIIRNTERDSDKITQIRDEFERIHGIRVILGPVFSNEVRYALNSFKNSRIPIISPTATDDGLTNLNKNFFQANPSFDMRGKVMAEYIYYVENKRNLAVLNAIDGYSPLLANSFINEFDSLGGSIILHETYQSKTFDLSKQVDRILASPDSIEGIYVPLADRMDAPVILSSLVKDSLYIPLYGNQDWFLAKGYETSPELSNMLTFTSDYFIDYNNEGYKDFGKKFFEQTNKDANRNILYGYDLANYVLNILNESNGNSTAIEMKMESGIIGKGFHNNISFGKERINRFLNIIRYKNGIFELTDKFRAGK